MLEKSGLIRTLTSFTLMGMEGITRLIKKPFLKRRLCHPLQ